MKTAHLIKIFPTGKVKDIDAYTIENEPIVSVDLMERAAGKIHDWILRHYDKSRPVKVFAGTGNNGGDALAVSRMLAESGFLVRVFLVRFSQKISEDCRLNLERLKIQDKVFMTEIRNDNEFPTVHKKDLILDGIFGSGLTRQVSGLYLKLIQYINKPDPEVIAIDIPSGLLGENNTKNNPEGIIKAAFTLSFQFPKLAFLFAENEIYTGSWEILSIGLHKGYIQMTESKYYYVTREFIKANKKKRKKFSHKGNFGHALLISGCYGKMGAAVLAARACLRTGVGLLTTHVPGKGTDIIQTSVPESMLSIDQSDILFSRPPANISDYNSIGIGPAIGCRTNSQKGMGELLEKFDKPLVIDADGINILSQNPDWLKDLPKNCILTPHPKEFERLTGKCTSGYERHSKQLEFAVTHKVVVVLKGAYTSVACPDGKCYFNSTGNPGMATAGSGDVLTGIILSLLSQSYEPCLAAIFGVYIHGAAGDLSKKEAGEESLIASDIIDTIGKAFLEIDA
jgi:NAD(P)H-hydrate epimerase